MQINSSMIKAAILALIIYFMRSDITLALVIALASYVLTMVNF